MSDQDCLHGGPGRFVFTHNQVVLPAEGRLGITVQRPTAFAIVDLTAA